MCFQIDGVEITGRADSNSLERVMILRTAKEVAPKKVDDERIAKEVALVRMLAGRTHR